MEIRSCPHCESEIEVMPGRIACPVCGLDPDLPRVAFGGASAYAIAREQPLEPISIGPEIAQPEAAAGVTLAGETR